MFNAAPLIFVKADEMRLVDDHYIVLSFNKKILVWALLAKQWCAQYKLKLQAAVETEYQHSNRTKVSLLLFIFRNIKSGYHLPFRGVRSSVKEINRHTVLSGFLAIVWWATPVLVCHIYWLIWTCRMIMLGFFWGKVDFKVTAHRADE